MTVKIIQGDALTVLKTLPDKSVNCCVTSPPYWGLRDYGTATWEGGNVECDHFSGFSRRDGKRKTPGGRGGSFSAPPEYFKATCAKCGAKRIDAQLGLERTPEEYVGKMVEVFREVRRVLRGDGTLWLNLGDSYGSRNGDTHTGFNERWDGTGIGGGKQAETAKTFPKSELKTNLKPKDLCGIPWLVAFALRADGWYLRQDIIWHKPNPMPESVTDRCTKAHEYIFLMSKSQRYFYDHSEIMEPAQYGEQHANKATSWGTNRKHPNKANVADYYFKGDNHTTSKMNDGSYGRNKRSVWTVSTAPFPGAHFATFPPKLIEPCILAGCPKGGIVLDPFGGSGTTGMVAENNGRNSILIELNEKYIDMIRRRTAQSYLFN